MELLPTTKIEQNETEMLAPEIQALPTVTSIVLELGGMAMKFAQVDRAPLYTDTHAENDSEHSFMLALVANELATKLYPEELDAGKVTQYSIVHDLIETITGDVATFHYSAEDMELKQQREHAALEELLNTLPPHTAKLLFQYEQQQEPEARFVRAVDKLLPVAVDILGSGEKLMQETYGVTTDEQLLQSHEKLHNRIATSFKEFPAIVDSHQLLCELFEEEFKVRITPQS